MRRTHTKRSVPLNTKLQQPKRNKKMVFFITSMATLMGTFTISSINIALPVMAAEFNVSLSAISWVSTIYILTLSSLLLVSGRMGDICGNKTILLWGFSLFALASGLAVVFANSFPALLGFRALQGIGGSMVIALCPAILIESFPPDERGRAIGINTIFVSLGLAIGPSLGGWMSSVFHWHSLFLINLPLGALGIIATLKFLPTCKGNNHKLDTPGAVLLAVFVCSLVLSINFLNTYGIFSPFFVIPVLTAALSLFLFLRVEKSSPDPLIRPELFREPKIALGSIISLCFHASQMMVVFLLPFYLIDLRGLPQDTAGLVTMAMPATIMFFSTAGGTLGDKFGLKPPVLVGLMLVLASSLLLSRLQGATPYSYAVLTLMLYGIGTGLITPPLNSSIISAAPADYRSLASGLTGALRSVAQALGISLASLMMARRSLAYEESAALLDSGEIFLLSLRDTFFLAAFLAVIAIAAAWNIPGKRADLQRQKGYEIHS